MGDSNLSILIISENSINKILADMLADRKIEILLENKSTEDLSGLILLTNKLNDKNEKIIHEIFKKNIPILGIKNGFEGLNIFFGGKKSQNIKKVDLSPQLFLSPGSKLSHIIGGSGWVKSDLDPTSNIFQKELSETFFASIISEEGEIIGFEKPGENWVFGINFDPTDSNLPKGFDNLITVFLDKCLESNT
tara:strand:- start:2564 stop:3139 length:576 start_codon:yes stop_codon:yes gene_type:complete